MSETNTAGNDPVDLNKPLSNEPVLSETVTTTTTDVIEYALPATPIATVENLDVTRYPQGQLVGEHQMRLPSNGVYLDDLNAEGNATVVPDANGVVVTPGGKVHADVTSDHFDGADPYDPLVATNNPDAVNATPDGFNAVDAPTPVTVSGGDSQISSAGFVAPTSNPDPGTPFPAVTTPAETQATSVVPEAPVSEPVPAEDITGQHSLDALQAAPVTDASGNVITDPGTPDVVKQDGDTVDSGATNPTPVEPTPATSTEPSAVSADTSLPVSATDTTTSADVQDNSVQ